MKRHLWTLAVLLSHWRRRPFQLMTLVIGLAVATALWSGVQALNVQARQSYDQAARLIGGDELASLRPTNGANFDQALYVTLRRAGWDVSPVVEGDVRIADRSIRIVGIDPVTLPQGAGPVTRDALDDGPETADGSGQSRAVRLLTAPSLALGDAETVAALGGVDARPAIGDGGQLPPLVVAASLPPETLVTDVGVAQALLDQTGRLSRLILTAAPETSAASLAELTGEALERVEPNDQGDLERLTDSFHLNLTAFGFLSFLVGLFIVHGAIGLAFEQRRPMLRTMRACGVSARALTAVMLLELTTISALAGIIGTVAGYIIASSLLPDVAASLRGLYGARVAGELSLQPSWWLAGVAISVIGALVAAGSSLYRAWRLPLFATAQPEAWAGAEARARRWQLATAVLLGAIALGALLEGSGLVVGFVLMGAVLLAAALLLPSALVGLLALAQRLTRGPVAQWFFADARQQSGGLSLALMALLLALAVNIGVGTMVDSFRQTFTGWLDQRLAAELYVGARDPARAADIADWLEARDDIDAVLPVWDAETRYRGFPVEVFGFSNHPTYSDHWPLLASLPDAWSEAEAGRAVLVSEQLARRFALEPGDPIEIAAPGGDWAGTVAAIYSDYGNPRGQVMIAVDELVARFPDAERGNFAVRVAAEAVDAVMADLTAAFGAGTVEVVDQRTIKDISQRIFDRTFAVTLALNTLTLIVAGIALLASLLTLADARLPQLAPLWALGLTRRRLAGMELVKAATLALLTALLAIPLGLAVAWILTNVINVEAFGWQLPVHVFPEQWLRLIVLALITAIVAAAWPAFSLRRMPPTKLLKVFADER